jgi:SAM-dependent methyltransferase
MVSLAKRATDPELLDLGVSEADMAGSLADLRFANRWLGNRGRLLGVMRPYLAPRADGSPARVLDVGCGSGDFLSWLSGHASTPVMTTGVDLKWEHLRAAPGSDFYGVAADARALPFAPGSFDVVVASLVLHHFDAGEAPRVLRECARAAARVVIINDLRRAWVLYAFGRVAFPLIFRSPVSVNDGLVSIRRAFTRDELVRAFQLAGLDAHVLSSWPYRLIAVAETGVQR